MSLDNAIAQAMTEARKSLKDYCEKVKECGKNGHPGGERVWGVGSFSKLHFCSTCKSYYETPYIPYEDYEWAERMMHVQITI